MFVRMRSPLRYAVSKIKYYEAIDDLDAMESVKYQISMEMIDGSHFVESYPSSGERDLHMVSLDKLVNKVEV